MKHDCSGAAEKLKKLPRQKFSCLIELALLFSRVPNGIVKNLLCIQLQWPVLINALPGMKLLIEGSGSRSILNASDAD